MNQVKASDSPLYDPNTLRTIFLNFEESDWEKALEDFHDTDIDLPATMIVDGKRMKVLAFAFAECLRMEWCRLATRDRSMSPWTISIPSKICLVTTH